MIDRPLSVRRQRKVAMPANSSSIPTAAAQDSRLPSIESYRARSYSIGDPSTTKERHFVDLSQMDFRAVYSGDESNASASSTLGYLRIPIHFFGGSPDKDVVR